MGLHGVWWPCCCVIRAHSQHGCAVVHGHASCLHTPAPNQTMHHPNLPTCYMLHVCSHAPQACYALYASLLLPFIDIPLLAAELTSAWLESLVSACLVALQYVEHGGIGDTMLGAEMALVAAQVLLMAVTVGFPTMEALVLWLRSKRAGKQAQPGEKNGHAAGTTHSPAHPGTALAAFALLRRHHL